MSFSSLILSLPWSEPQRYVIAGDELTALMAQVGDHVGALDKAGRFGLYTGERKGKPAAVKGQTRMGKIAEHAVSRILHRSFGFPLVGPDYEAYGADSVGWRPDLDYGDGRRLHVKSCKPGSNYGSGGHSWVFQLKTGTRPADPMMHGTECDNDLLAMCVVDESQKAITVDAWMAIWWTVKDLISPMGSAELSDKRAIYLSHCLPIFTFGATGLIARVSPYTGTK